MKMSLTTQTYEYFLKGRTALNAYSALLLLIGITAYLSSSDARAGSSFKAVWFPDGNIEWYAEATPGPHAFLTTDEVNSVIVPTMGYMAERLPLTLQRRFARAHGQLTFMKSSMAHSGHPSGAWTLGYWSPAGEPKDIAFFKDRSVRPTTTAHEFGHALGMPHEHQRADAQQDLVKIAPHCTLEPFNYSPVPGPFFGDHTQFLSPIDPTSRMFYRNSCVTMAATDQPADLPLYKGDLALYSPHDINSIYRMYARELGAPNDTEQFGHAIAIADFDDDGYEDIAVAANEMIQIDERKLSIFFFRGVALDRSEFGGGRKYMPWFVHTVVSELQNDATTRAYRLAFASGDFNNNGRHELAVGYPNHAGERRVRIYAQALPTAAPSEIVIKGSVETLNEFREPYGLKGLRILQEFGPADVNANFLGRDTFATTLKVGRLTSRDRDDLVIGWPTATTIIPHFNGPGAAVHLSNTEVSKAPLDLSTLAIIQNPAPMILSQPGGPFPPNPDFGATIAMIPGKSSEGLPILAPSMDQLAIGAPGTNNNRGSVYLYAGSVDANSLPKVPLLLTTLTGQVDSRFGSTLEGISVPSPEPIDPNRSLPTSSIVVGAPNEHIEVNGRASRAGAVYLYGLNFLNDPKAGTENLDAWFLGRIVAPGRDWAPGMKWGAALAAIQQGPSFKDVQVGIGSPEAKHGKGLVYLWRPFDESGAFTEAGVTLAPDLAGGRFGEALSPIAFSTEPTGHGFAIGSPTGLSNSLASGFVEVVIHHEDPLTRNSKPDRQTLSQITTGDRRTE